MKIRVELSDYEKREVARIAEEEGVSVDGLEQFYKDCMACNFWQDLRDIARENYDDILNWEEGRE